MAPHKKRKAGSGSRQLGAPGNWRRSARSPQTRKKKPTTMIDTEPAPAPPASPVSSPPSFSHCFSPCRYYLSLLASCVLRLGLLLGRPPITKHFWIAIPITKQKPRSSWLSQMVKFAKGSGLSIQFRFGRPVGYPSRDDEDGMQNQSAFSNKNGKEVGKKATPR